MARLSETRRSQETSRLHQTNPTCEAHYALGTVQTCGQSARRGQHLDNAVRIKSNYAVALLRGSIRTGAGLCRSGQDYNRVRDRPRFTTVLYWRAKSLRDVKEYHKSLMDLDEFLEAAPDFVEGVYLRSNVRAMTGDFEGAVADLDRVIELDPKRALALSNRGLARFRIGDKAGAVADLRKAMAMDASRKAKIEAVLEQVEDSEPAVLTAIRTDLAWSRSRWTEDLPKLGGAGESIDGSGQEETFFVPELSASGSRRGEPGALCGPDPGRIWQDPHDGIRAFLVHGPGPGATRDIDGAGRPAEAVSWPAFNRFKDNINAGAGKRPAARDPSGFRAFERGRGASQARGRGPRGQDQPG